MTTQLIYKWKWLTNSDDKDSKLVVNNPQIIPKVGEKVTIIGRGIIRTVEGVHHIISESEHVIVVYLNYRMENKELK